MKLINTSQEASVLVSSIAALMAAISAAAAVANNIRSNRQYKKSIEPQLSMHLVRFDMKLYLQIKNTGKSVARGISLSPIQITNNGVNDEQPRKDGLFAMQFDLYPEELVQTEICMSYDTISIKAFPSLEVSVSYRLDCDKKKVAYQRTVTMVPAYENKVFADVKVDLESIEESMDRISNSTNRTANYLTGSKLAPFDNVCAIPNKSLAEDIQNAFKKE